MEKTKKVKKKRKWLVFQKIEFRIGKCETNLFPTLTIKKPTNQKLKWKNKQPEVKKQKKKQWMIILFQYTYQ